jgi:hypothetical protein
VVETAKARAKRLARNRARSWAKKKEENARAKAWRTENPARVVENNQKWRTANKPYLKAISRKRTAGQSGPFKPSDGRDWKKRNREKHLAAKRESTNRRRNDVFLEALQHYSNGKNCCYCCGESVIRLLCLDHINGGGNKHKREVKWTRLYQWAKQNGWPPILRVACHSCNIGAHLNGGACPHST